MGTLSPIDPGRIEVTVECPPIRALLDQFKHKMMADLDAYFLELENRIILGVTVRDNDRGDERIGYTITVQREERAEVDKFGNRD